MSKQTYRVLLRVGRGHPFVAARQESVRHVGLEHRLDGPFDKVMLVRAFLPPRPPESHARFAVLVLSEHAVRHGWREKKKGERAKDEVGETEKKEREKEQIEREPSEKKNGK